MNSIKYDEMQILKINLFSLQNKNKFSLLVITMVYDNWISNHQSNQKVSSDRIIVIMQAKNLIN